MKFKILGSAVRKQIRASMKRTAEKLIKLNSDRIETLQHSTAFNMWTNRYISTLHGTKYYDLIAVDEELFEEFRTTMKGIFSKLAAKPPVANEAPAVKYPKYYIEKPATEKQILYARYLMDMVRNEPLPEKKYTMYEIGLLINDLKNKVNITG